MFTFLGHLFDIVFTFPCLNALVLLYHWIGDFGLTLLLFTIIVQLIFSPLTLYGMYSQKRMNTVLKTLEPQLQALKEQYSNDPQKRRAEGQALYKKHHLNPAGGCLTVVIPILFLIALWVILGNQVISGQPSAVNRLLYPFIPQLTTAINTHLSWFSGYAIDLTRPEPYLIHIFSIFAGILVFIQIKMVMPTSGIPTTANDASGKKTTRLIAIIIVILAVASFWMLPAGLVLFCIVATFIAILLQFYVNGWNWGALYTGKQDNLVRTLQANNRFFYHGNTHLPEVALTFDDGPDPKYTAQVLAVLQRYNVKATFFSIGHLAREYPDLVRQEVADGHVVGNHTWNHSRLSSLSTDDIAKEINDTSDELQKITGTRPTFFRPPFGETNDQALTIIKNLELTTFMWNNMAFDWLMPAPKVISARVTRRARNGMIVLLHDGGGDRTNTVAALPTIIENLQARGFQFVTLSQLVDHAR